MLQRRDNNRGGDRRTPRGPRDEFEGKTLDLARVTRVAAGGRKFRFRATVVVGNKKGKVGVGIGKGQDVQQAVAKATRAAKKHLIEVPIVNETIAHQVEAKFGASRVLLKPVPKGRGLIAGGAVRVICERAGIGNISAKFLSKTKNPLNNAMATIEALKLLKAKRTTAEAKPEEPAQAEV